MMYKAMLVDDDAIIREGLVNLIDWEMLNIEIVYAAASGTEALAYLQKHTVHLLITDVSMPEMTGIELISQAKKRYSYMKYIVISAYSDFAYVKEAARLGIENYILKPIDEQELKSTLLSAVEKLDTQSGDGALKEDGFLILQNNIVTRLLYEEIDEFELLEKAEFIHFSLNEKEYILCYISLDKEQTYAGFGSKIRALFRYYDGMNTMIVQDLEENYIVIFSGSHIAGQEDKIRTKVKNNIHYLEEEYGCKLKYTMSDVVTSYERLPACYRVTRERHEDELTQKMMHAMTGRILEYVNLHYMEDINLKIISYKFGMNAFYLGRLFKDNVKISFTDYLTDLRIEKAKELLADGTHKACEVSRMVGYVNTNYFYTIFKKKTGVSPSAYASRK